MSRLRTPFALSFACLILALLPNRAAGDESGVSFWLPGIFGSLAAVPAQPGWAFTTMYYHTSVDASAEKNFAIGGRIAAGLDARADLMLFGPTYVFPTPFMGGQLALTLLSIGGRNQVSVDATLTGPLGNTISGSRTDTVSGFGDLIPQATLKWNHGVHNYMAYLTGDIPVGSYSPNRFANLGIGHGAIDGGVGYTYLDPQKGHEFSIVTGFTHNFENEDTQYKNGLDWHVDWGLSQFLSKQFFVGAVGYLYNQLGADSGPGARLGPFRSRVAGVGPQLGYIFPIGDKWQGFLNLKGYYEFEAKARPEGWNVWLVFNIAPAAPRDQVMSRVTK